MQQSDIRRALLRSAAVYRLNARYKAFRTTRSLETLRRAYAQESRRRGIAYSEESAVRAVRAALRRRGISWPRGRSARILWVGANWPQDNSGFLQALERIGEVTTFRNVRGGYGVLFEGKSGPVRVFDPAVAELNDAALLTQVEEMRRTNGIDLLLGQMWANFVSTSVLQYIQSLGIITVNVSMDDRLPEHWRVYRGRRLGSVGLVPGLDLVLTTSPECCEWYAVEGAAAVFWPLASDAGRFAPAVEVDKTYDVSFVGNKYGLRGEIVTSLMRAGVAVEPFGGGWPNGPVDAERASEIFARSRIILGVGTVAHNRDLFTLKLRDFDAPMAGALYITHRNPDLMKLFIEGQEIECYGDVAECVRKVRHYLAHPEQRRAIATAGLARARREHTWDRRFERLVEILAAS